MPTERITIVTTESGSRVVKRSIESIGEAGLSAARSIRVLQNALFVLGGAGAIRAITGIFDTLTNYENRLRLTATSAENLETIQRKLFQAANDSRTEFESLAEIYSRTALSVKGLGVSQQETIAFTERLAKATIISGASAREANAALVQLAQGLASNRLSGDELRSVLEQLPYVADVIARQLGVTRGELRQFGKEGKISAQTVLDAFRNAGPEIDALFAQTIPTIGQAISVFGNQIKQALDQFDDATGFSSGIALSIIAVGNAIDALVVSATLATAVIAGIFADKYAARAANAVKATLEFNRAVKDGRVVLLDSTAAEVQKSQAILATAQARATATSAQLAALNGDRQQLSSNLALIESQRARALQQVQLQQGMAQATGRTSGLVAAQQQLNNSTRALLATRAALRGVEAQLATAQGASTAATAALSAAQVRATAATAAANTITARLAATFPLLTRAVAGTAAAVRGLFGLLIANPITVLLVAITAAAFALRNLGDASEQVNRVADRTDKVMMDVAEAFKIADRTGKDLAETYNALSVAQLQLQRTEALQAQKDAIAAFADQLVGFNAVLTDLRTIATFDITFAGLANGVRGLVGEFQAGEISLKDFEIRLSEMAATANNARFTAFVRGIVDSIQNIDKASEQTRILDALIATLSGTATAAQTALLRMASGLDSVAGSASAAANAVEFFIGKIPALAAAQKVQAGLAEAQSKFAAGSQELKQRLKSGNLTLDAYSEKQKNLSSLFKQATAEIDGSAEKTRDAAKALKTYSDQAELAAKSGTERQIARATQEYKKLETQLKASGASQGDLNKAQQNYQTIVAGIKRDAANKGGGGGGSVAADLAKRLDGYQQEIDLLYKSAEERRLGNEVIKIEDELKRSLTATELEQVGARLRNLEVAKEAGRIIDELQGPQLALQYSQEALNNLFEQGTITLGEYTQQLAKLKTVALEAETTLSGGFKASLNSAILSAKDFGSAIGNEVVGAFDSAADALVEFAKTGKLNIKSLFFDLFANLTKLAAKQFLLQLLGGVLGLPNASASGLGGAKLGIFGFNSGGSILPSGSGTTDSQFVSFAKRPDERVDILTPQQQKNQQEAMNGKNSGQNTVVTPPPNVNVAALLSPSDIVGAFDNSEGDTLIINMLQRNASSVRAIAGTS